ncbi:hypothetical protein J3B02_000924 [Coemansia erecta]|uniref:Chromo domain-containing protein n=1 Tax=Coemansia asiatica TaxID=1052880 RepID=A0A9W7XJJ8_9FUNG|nr:hypothetical protein LPJ64_004112 [Coemansia asiatica]KAJ2857534.1 hypothetical protein J3B02_000924 [Coemansia erecta]
MPKVEQDIKKDLDAMDASDNEVAASGEELDDSDEVYVVERIMDHKQENRQTLYRIRWEGYGSDDDTWEGEDNILDKTILKKYWDSYKNKESSRADKTATKPKPRRSINNGLAASVVKDDKSQLPINKRRRTAEDVAMESDDASGEDLLVGRSKNSSGGAGPADSDDWEANLKEIVTIGQYDNEKFFVIIKWKNGTSTEHPIEMTYAKCPQSMLKFFEARLRFRTSDH